MVALEGPDGDLVGGLQGQTGYCWLFIELLFVPEASRGHGLGAELMLRAETEAVVRGCHGAWLDTFEFQARGFYEGLGYTCFGELEDYPFSGCRAPLSVPVPDPSSGLLTSRRLQSLS